jgi:hypothetical protein
MPLFGCSSLGGDPGFNHVGSLRYYLESAENKIFYGADLSKLTLAPKVVLSSILKVAYSQIHEHNRDASAENVTLNGSYGWNWLGNRR